MQIFCNRLGEDQTFFTILSTSLVVKCATKSKNPVDN